MPTNEMMDRCHAGGEGEDDVTRMSACYVYCQGDGLEIGELHTLLRPVAKKTAAFVPRGPLCFWVCFVLWRLKIINNTGTIMFRSVNITGQVSGLL